MSEEQGPGASIGSFRVLLALGGVAIWLVLAGVVGAIHVATNSDTSGAEEASTGGRLTPGAGSSEIEIDPETGIGYIIDPVTGERIAVDPTTGERLAIDPATGKPIPKAGGQGGGTGGSTGGATGGTGGTTGPAPPPGDRTGVSATEIKVGIHAPKTIGGAPLNLAEDPIEGIEIYTKYLNDNGGIWGRKVVLDIADDRYETSGGKQAGIDLIQRGNFIISGTLGVDQINAVAVEANKEGVPYHAAGGHEPQFGDMGLFQIGTSYDTHVIQLARWMATDGSGLKNKKIGISVLNSNLLLPVADVFKAEAARVGLNSNIKVVTIEKPTQQTTYTEEINDLRSAGTEVVIPMQDPISTGRMVNECAQPPACTWTYTFSNFAHEGDTALALMGGQWALPGRPPVRGLAAGCYYLHSNADNPAHCARMDKAHQQWRDTNGQSDWEKDGQGGASGYQIMSMLFEGLRRAGQDPTRESYRAGMITLNNYDDLITSPITFAGKSSYSHGSDKMVVFEAQANAKYRQHESTPGLVQF